MRIVVDLDGTICPIKKDGQSYADLIPLPGAADRLKKWRQAGHYIIIQTARNMATQQSNLGKVVKNIGKITLDWLQIHGLEYDEIYFGKPNGEVYIDDRAMRFDGSWESFSDDDLERQARVR